VLKGKSYNYGPWQLATVTGYGTTPSPPQNPPSDLRTSTSFCFPCGTYCTTTLQSSANLSIGTVRRYRTVVGAECHTSGSSKEASVQRTEYMNKLTCGVSALRLRLNRSAPDTTGRSASTTAAGMYGPMPV